MVTFSFQSDYTIFNTTSHYQNAKKKEKEIIIIIIVITVSQCYFSVTLILLIL